LFSSRKHKPGMIRASQLPRPRKAGSRGVAVDAARG
jgi:hypothetical protein